MSRVTRRAFVATGAGLVLAFRLRPRGAAAKSAAVPSSKDFRPNALLRVGTDDVVTVIVPRSEMGQGVRTSLPMLIAEELEADWSRIVVEQSPEGREYIDPDDALGWQLTGGSTSIRGAWKSFPEAGAAAREMLVAAAARGWGVEPSRCRAEKGVVHGPDGKTATFGSLALPAARERAPRAPSRKAPKDWTVVGKPLDRLDVPSKVDGTATFGVDVTLPGMRIAVVARPPVFGARLKSFDAAKASSMSGVRAVLPIAAGVAVLADGYWQALQARDALKIEWDARGNDANSSDRIREEFAKAGAGRGKSVRSDGSAAALDGAAKKVEAVYELPLQAHATMEPQNCTAWIHDGLCEIWGPFQNQTKARIAAENASGLSQESIVVHTTLLGGGFGRRLEWDFAEEAVEIAAKAGGGAPVKVMWSREDDTRHDFYRPPSLHVLKAGLTEKGEPLAWFHRIVCPSIVSRIFWAANFVADPTSTEGARDLPYAFPHLRVELVRKEAGVPVGFWRSVGNSHNGFVTESFLDEVAVAAGQDPLAFRRALLASKKRDLAVLELAAAKAAWAGPAPREADGVRRGRGLAVHHSFGSRVAQVADVAVDPDGEVRVERVVCAIDCGRVVNPSIVEAQMQSGIVFGLSSLHGAITIEKGKVKQSNFHDFRVARLKQMPRVEVHLVPSEAKPGGVGEPGVPPLAPAVTNAVFAATGVRIRRLPIDANLLRLPVPAAAADGAAR